MQPQCSSSAVTSKLGTSDCIQAADSEGFAIERRLIMEPADYEDGVVTGNPPQVRPLIKLTKFRCNAEALSNGTVFVDLPGTGDANAARNAV